MVTRAKRWMCVTCRAMVEEYSGWQCDNCRGKPLVPSLDIEVGSEDPGCPCCRWALNIKLGITRCDRCGLTINISEGYFKYM